MERWHRSGVRLAAGRWSGKQDDGGRDQGADKERGQCCADAQAQVATPLMLARLGDQNLCGSGRRGADFD